MGFLTGIFIMIVSPICAGWFIDNKWCRRRLLRQCRKDNLRLLFSYWLLGVLPVLGMFFIYILFSAIGNGALWLF